MISYLSPSLKLLLSLIFTVIVAFAQWDMTFVLCGIAVILSLFISGVKVINIVKAFRPLWFFVVVFAVIGAISPDTLYGKLFFVRFILIALAVSVLTQTTTQTDFQKSIITLLKPLKILHIPIEDIAFVIALTLYFIPRITEEWQKLVIARKSRGIIMRELSFNNRIKVMFLNLEKLIINSVKIAESTAISADSRCYGLGKFTPRNEENFTKNDCGILVLFLIFCNFLVLLEFLH